MSRTNNKITPLYFLGFVCLIFFIIVFGLVGVARGVNMGSNLNMQGAYKVLNLPTPTNPFDAATKSYVDSALGGANLWAFSTSYSKLQPVSPDGPTLDFCIDQIDSYGKSWIGIGTDNPQYKLDVYGQIRNTAGMISDAITINTAGAYAIDSSGSADVRLGGDLFVNGYVGIGKTNPQYGLDVSTAGRFEGNLTVGNNLTVYGTVNSNVKNFVIDHPLDPENKSLVHSSLEGPEIAVFYRGEGQLENGKVEIKLPDYFEALTRKANRTVLLTPKFDSDELISNLAASAVDNGKFKVRASDNNNPNQKFYWEVKAVRADLSILEVERLKNDEASEAKY